MSDYKTAIIPDTLGLFPHFDLEQSAWQLATDEGLETAIIQALFSDARARDDDDIPDRNGDRRGWFADSYAEVPGDAWGSRLWLYERSLRTAETANGIQAACEDALRFLIEDGVIDSLSVSVEFPRQDAISFTVVCYRARQPARRYQFQQFWSGT